ncbi:unnamed protein product [Albugo candida]|uniref:Uncharacterized protein n=1 Tax=Albugo candida TaxID=65357 RepID=A0A024GAP8_9STRA|nr:unnamed protein product [Albugo candida]|eukprot:CCI43911.1 unnamed protein product [Albugo candida]
MSIQRLGWIVYCTETFSFFGSFDLINLRDEFRCKQPKREGVFTLYVHERLWRYECRISQRTSGRRFHRKQQIDSTVEIFEHFYRESEDPLIQNSIVNCSYRRQKPTPSKQILSHEEPGRKWIAPKPGKSKLLSNFNEHF